uniref:Uncharacterized protein n=1 Tax=Magnetospirillum gryphiswaldense TaxID=55518 RepID=A4U4B0_9PROT|nr:hypothetical protein MGR_2454 [Magnetospirillum gryphiswaldense MSR-1]
MDDKEINHAVASQIADMATAGKPEPVDPDDAEMMAAFVETALDDDDALGSHYDHVAEGGEE